jgi:hypothetical protein
MIHNRQDAGMDFSLGYYIPNTEDGNRKNLQLAENIVVRLHSGDGNISDPEPNDPRRGIGAGNGWGFSPCYAYRFPWNRNVLEEAWIEVRFPKQTYWIEIPYGFTRNPAAPLTPIEVRRGSPTFVKTMKPGKTDRIVPWSHVNYDFGPIQNNWGLSVNIANPVDAEAEIVLYRELDKSYVPWELHSPRTALTIKQPDGGTLKSECMCIRKHKDGVRRSDNFDFRRLPDDERCWGTAVVKVDDKSYECIVPSSLFKYEHGVTRQRENKPLATSNPVR